MVFYIELGIVSMNYLWEITKALLNKLKGSLGSQLLVAN
jgi:hypothetical protein